MFRCRMLVPIVVALLTTCVLFVRADDNSLKLPTGLRIPATLKASLSSGKANVGDTIKLDVVAAVHGKDHKVVIPAHASLTGIVTQAVPFHGAGQPSMLAISVQKAEWKGGQGSLDAAVFGVMAMSDFHKQDFSAMGPKDEYEMEQPLRGGTTEVEAVEDLKAATLRHQISLNIVDQRTVSRVPGANGRATSEPITIMELKLSTDPAVRTYFTAEKSNVELPREFMVILLNGMKIVQ